MINIRNLLLIYMTLDMILQLLNIKISLVQKLFMEERISCHLNYVMIIAKHVINLDYQFTFKNVILVWKNILMII